jgi:hypothetical protein
MVRAGGNTQVDIISSTVYGIQRWQAQENVTDKKQ